MSKATIISSLKEGLYNVDLNFNTEVIEFNKERYRLRLDDIANVDEPAADNALADAEIDLSEASDTLQELIKQLSGQPSAELTATLAAIDNDLSNASAALDQVNTGLLGASAEVANSLAALPGGVSAEILAAYATANAALTLAFSAVNDEQNDLSTAQGHLGDVQDAVVLVPPDLIAAQNSLGLLRADLATTSTDHVIASGQVNNAHSEIQAARNLLPGTVDYDVSRADLDAAIAEFTDISTQHALAATLEGDAATRANKAQDLLTPGNEAVRKQVKDALNALNRARTARIAAQFIKDSLDLEYQELLLKIDQLDAVPVKEVRTVWCADLTEDLPGGTEVGTMEVPGELEPYKETVIRPAFSPEHTHHYNRERDGWLTPAAAVTPACYFYNRAMLPGWQVFRPTFRFAIVTFINPPRTTLLDGTVELKATLDVVLIFPNISSQQGLNVTPQSIPEGSFAEAAPVSFDHVPVKYMDCDADAFAVGDIVVVQFDNQKAENPRVVGFRDHPKDCCASPILTPFGGLGGQVVDGIVQWTFKPEVGLAYGEVAWYGKQHVLSWRGTGDRYHGITPDDIFYVDRLQNKIFYRGKELITAPGRVVGVAIHLALEPANYPDRLLAVVIHEEDIDKDEAGLYTGAMNTNMSHQFYWRTWPIVSTEDWMYLATFSLPNPISDDPVMVMHPWLFHEEGAEGRTMFYSPVESPFGGPMYFDHEIKATVSDFGVTLENLGNNPNSFSSNTGPYTVMVDYAEDTRVTMQINLTSESGIPFDAFHDHATLTFGEQSLLYELFVIDGHGGNPNAMQIMQDFFTYLDPARGYVTYVRRDYQFPEEGGTTAWEVWKNGTVLDSIALTNPPIEPAQTALKIAFTSGAADRKGNLAALVGLYGNAPPAIEQTASYLTDSSLPDTVGHAEKDIQPLGMRC